MKFSPGTLLRRRYYCVDPNHEYGGSGSCVVIGSWKTCEEITKIVDGEIVLATGNAQPNQMIEVIAHGIVGWVDTNLLVEVT